MRERESEIEMEIVGLIVAGVIIGLLGKLVAPGDKDNIPLWATLLCGVGGVLRGGAIYRAFGGDGSGGIDWTRRIVAIATAVVLTVVASPPRVANHQPQPSGVAPLDPAGATTRPITDQHRRVPRGGCGHLRRAQRPEPAECCRCPSVASSFRCRFLVTHDGVTPPAQDGPAVG